VASEGSSIWCFRMKSWGEQVGELVDAGKYADALALLDTIDAVLLPDKVCAHPAAYSSPLILAHH
jgi:Vam6/Vps39-like protein vacuolar protein sorting-associated protein 39